MSVGEANILEARTTFENLANNAFTQQRTQGSWQYVAREREGGDIQMQVVVPIVNQGFVEWDGEKEVRDQRKLEVIVPLTKYHKSMKLKREEVVYDKTGSSNTQIQTFLGNNGYLMDRRVFEALDQNARLGPDDVPLISSSHPIGGGEGGFDNSTTTALGHNAVRVGRAFLETLSDEDGEPFGLIGKTLVVHPNERRLALEIANADTRPVFQDDPLADTSATAGGATSVTNVYKGDYDVIVTPYITAGNWFLLDPRFPPLVLVVWRDPESHVKDRMDDDNRYYYDEFHYSVESDLTAWPAHPWSVYGNVSN